MARTRKTTDNVQTKATATGALSVIAETTEEPTKKLSDAKTDDLVYIACGMPLGIKFDDVDNGNGGYKTVSFPGVNHALKGKKKGILAPAGNAVLTALPRKEWEDIKRKHGRERAFTRVPPLLMEMKSEKEFKARRDEIAEMRTGVEPVDPKTVGVEKAQEN